MKNYLTHLDQKFKSFYHEIVSFSESHNASDLLTPNRLDIIIKILYFEFLYGINKTYLNRKILYIYYKKQKRLNNYSEFKNFNEYENEFKLLINSINNKTNIDQFFLTPVDKDYDVIDSGNKLALASILKKKINIIRFLSKSTKYNLNTLDNYYKLKRNILITDYLILNYVRYNENLRIILLYPRRKSEYEAKTLKLIQSKGKIIIKKRLNVYSLINAYYIVKNLYFGSNWIGSLNNDYKGALWKAKALFKGTNYVTDVLLFYPNDKRAAEPDELKKMKEKIRKYHNIHYHSIHSGDNQVETLRYAKLFFHSESNKILSHKKNNFFINFERVLEILNNEKLDQEKFVFSGSMTLAAIGIRAPKDIDIIHEKDFNFDLDIFNNSLLEKFGGLHSHNIHLKRYLPKFKISEFIYNPECFFYYMGFKFIHPKILLEFKSNRYKVNSKEKDYTDIINIKNYLKTLNS